MARRGGDSGRAGTPLKGLIGWASYDWANSPFSTLIITFVFSVYFSRGIVGDEVHGQALWGYTIGLSGLAIALLSPILGAIADAGGRRKPWLFAFTAACVVATGMTWFAEPDPAFLVFAVAAVVIANLGFEFGVVFNNAMLPDLVSEERLGRWSGWAWGLGYFGGLAALVVVLFAFVQTDTPLLGLNKAEAEHVRIVGPVVAVWLALFSVPLFVFTPDRRATGIRAAEAISRGRSTVRSTLINLRAHANVARFLLARMIYTDGITTIFVIGALFAAGTFAMDEAEVLMFGIALNVTAGLGALGFAWVDDWLGSKRTIVIALSGLLIAGGFAVTARDVVWFWIAGAALGIFFGPAQAASRSMMSRLAPPALRTEFFGFYAFSGKSTAFLGPLVAGVVTEASGSQRAGLATALVFIAVGLALFLTVREAPAAKRAESDA